MKLKFYKNLVFMSFILAVLIALLKYLMNFYSQGNSIWFALVFFFLITILSSEWTMAANKSRDKKFIRRFFLSTGMRIIFASIFLAIYLVINKERDTLFVLSFMALYLFYTIFEIYHLVAKLRREN